MEWAGAAVLGTLLMYWRGCGDPGSLTALTEIPCQR